MAIHPIRTYPDPGLKKASEPVDVIDDRIRNVLEEMAETMYAAGGIGLAAPQIGINLRMIVLDPQRGKETSGLLKLVNPKIVSREGHVDSEEGCLSLPDLIVEVDRSEKIKVEATLPDGNPTTIESEGLLAIVLQHEIDHLDGALLVDRLSGLRRHLYQRKRLREESRDSYA